MTKQSDVINAINWLGEHLRPSDWGMLSVLLNVEFPKGKAEKVALIIKLKQSYELNIKLNRIRQKRGA